MLLSSQPSQMTANERSGQQQQVSNSKKDDIGRIRTCAYKDDGLNVAP